MAKSTALSVHTVLPLCTQPANLDLVGVATQFPAMSGTELWAHIAEPATRIPGLSLIRPLGILFLLLLPAARWPLAVPQSCSS